MNDNPATTSLRQEATARQADEWTEERIAKIINNNPILCAGVIARELNRLNAALDAERDDRISWQELYEKTNEQLAAERSRIKVLESGTGLNAVIATNQKLREQLAAAVEALEYAKAHIPAKYTTAHERIDAALTKVKP